MVVIRGPGRKDAAKTLGSINDGGEVESCRVGRVQSLAT